MSKWRDQVRTAFGHGMKRDVILLTIVEHGVRMYEKGDTVGALNEREHAHVRKAADDIRNAKRRLKALSERCTNETV